MFFAFLRTHLRSTGTFARQPNHSVFMSTVASQRIHILGVGNLGKYVARGLRKACPELPITLLFHRPDLWNQWKDGAKAIEYTRGTFVDKTSGFDIELLPEDVSKVGKMSPITNLILLTKTYNSTLSLRRVKSLLSKTSTILFVQNGIGTIDEAHHTLFEDEASRPQLWTGVCSAGIYSTSPFSITHAGVGPLLIGPNIESEGSGAHIANMLFKARDYLLTSVVTSSEIKVAQLLKLVVNAIINPLTAIFDCKNREVLEGPRDELIRLLIKEIGPIIRSLVPPDSQHLVDDLDPQGTTLMFADESLIRRAHLTAIKTGANTSSMLQDVRHGRQTEIDYINGYVVSHGECLGRQCRNNKALVDMVKSRTVIKDNQISSYFHM